MVDVPARAQWRITVFENGMADLAWMTSRKERGNPVWLHMGRYGSCEDAEDTMKAMVGVTVLDHNGGGLITDERFFNEHGRRV